MDIVLTFKKMKNAVYTPCNPHVYIFFAMYLVCRKLPVNQGDRDLFNAAYNDDLLAR